MERWQFVSSVLAFLLLVGAAVVVLLSKKEDVGRATDRENVRATKQLLETRDLQLADRKRDLEILEAEHKQLIQVNTKEIIAAWQTQQKAMYFTENARLRAECEELRIRLGHHESL